jgi:5-methylcytosine-specific restriction endonuclease McrA
MLDGVERGPFRPPLSLMGASDSWLLIRHVTGARVTLPADPSELRTCLLPPLPEHEIAAGFLSAATDAILAHDLDRARELARQADMPELLQFARRLMGAEDPEIHRKRSTPKPPAPPTKVLARMPTAREIRELFKRDGWRCRWCGCRVASPQAQDAMRACLPGAIPWGDEDGYHGAFFALTASVDHVVPYSAGGSNDLENLVAACWSCQFGRGAYTIEQFGLVDPRSRPPLVDGWDGLCRVIGHQPAAALIPAITPAPPVADGNAGRARPVTRHPISYSEAAWLAKLNGAHSPPSRKLVDLLDSCADIGVSSSTRKVLVARMTVAGITATFMGIEPNGDVHIPWSIGDDQGAIDGRQLFRRFVKTLEEGIPGIAVHETARMWNVTRTDWKRLNILELLDRPTVVRAALDALYVSLSGGLIRTETGR